MNNEELGRTGVACVIGVLGALVEAQVELCSGFSMVPNAILYWLLMIGGSGVVLDATKGSSKKMLLLASALTATSFLGVAVVMSIIDVSGNFCFSSATENHPAMPLLAIIVWVATCLGVFLLSFSGPMIKNIVSVLAKNKTSKLIENISKSIREFIGLLMILILILKLI